MPAPSSAESDPAVATACQATAEWLAARSDGLAETLVAWAECNSGSDNQAGLLQLADLITAYADFLPVSPETLYDPVDGEPCALRWRCNPGDSSLPRVLLNGHIDTVFGPDHAFQRCHYSEDGTHLHGPGVADMKGGLVILFAALQAFLCTEFKDRLAWEILLTFDEEVGSEKNKQHLQAAARRNDLGIVFESSPHHEELIRNRMGTGRIDVICTGEAAHAGRNFDEGRNAILALGQFLAETHEMNRTVPGSIVNVGVISGGGPINVVPDFAKASLNVRAPTPAVQEALLEDIHKLAGEVANATGCRLAIRGGFSRPPKVVDPATEQLLLAWQQIGAVHGWEIYWRDTGGASDGNILAAAGLPTVDNLGAVGTHLHSDAEYTELPRLVDRAMLNTSFLIHLAAGQLSASDDDFITKLRFIRKEQA
jgi:glutamate carboxypeptidase